MVVETTIRDSVAEIYARHILKFLRGTRLINNGLTELELEHTQTFARATETERQALRFVVAMTPRHGSPPSTDDGIRSTARDAFLMRFADGESLDILKSQRRNWIQEIRNLQFAMERETEGRADITSARPFAWIFGRQ
jgi:hypothetical protein